MTGAALRRAALMAIEPATLNLGMTHMLAKHRRLKANIGTGYGEPGLGELFYNWEMYGGTGADHLGWYWIGNPNLKPEKSLNIDLSLEGENERTYGKVGIFHNEISDYMTHYFTGQKKCITGEGLPDSDSNAPSK